MPFNDVHSRTTRVLSPHTLYSDGTLNLLLYTLNLKFYVDFGLKKKGTWIGVDF